MHFFLLEAKSWFPPNFLPVFSKCISIYWFVWIFVLSYRKKSKESITLYSICQLLFFQLLYGHLSRQKHKVKTWCDIEENAKMLKISYGFSIFFDKLVSVLNRIYILHTVCWTVTQFLIESLSFDSIQYITILAQRSSWRTLGFRWNSYIDIVIQS